MSITATPQQLLLVKQLYDDACILVTKTDDLSLTKALILLDLSVEQMLSQVLRDIHPGFAPGRKDVFWHALWQQARPVLEARGCQLLHYRELSSLHEVRNLAQHNASIPTQAEVRRYTIPAQEMLGRIFKDVYEQDFESVTLWDLIENVDLRHWLKDCELALNCGQTSLSIAGCKVAYEMVISAIQQSSRDSKLRGSWLSDSSRVPSEFPSRLADYLKKMQEKMEFLDNEVVAIGMGMPLVDTRRFRNSGRDVLVFYPGSGDIQIVLTAGVNVREEFKEEARFMLNYLSRMIRLVYEAYPGVIEAVEVKKPLREQRVWRDVNRDVDKEDNE